MPIKVQNALPAKEILENENIFVMDENRAMHQDIRPLQVCILNLMPVKQDTELQLLRALSNTPLHVEVTFMKMNSHISLNTPIQHLNRFYNTFDELKKRKFDGQVFLYYLAWYGLGRAFIEGLRTDSLYIGSFRVSQLLAAVTCLVSVGILLYMLAFKRPDPKAMLVNRAAASAQETAEEDTSEE